MYKQYKMIISFEEGFLTVKINGGDESHNSNDKETSESHK